MQMFLQNLEGVLRDLGPGTAPDRLIKECRDYGSDCDKPIMEELRDAIFLIKLRGIMLRQLLQEVKEGLRSCHVCKAGLSRIRKDILVSRAMKEQILHAVKAHACIAAGLLGLLGWCTCWHPVDEPSLAVVDIVISQQPIYHRSVLTAC